MRQIFLTAAAIALTGCASPQQQYAAAMNAPAWQVCYVAISGNGPRQAAYQALSDRRIDCNQHAAIVQARMQQDQANVAAGAAMLRAARPQAAPVPATTTTTCRTVWNGSAYVTQCY